MPEKQDKTSTTIINQDLLNVDSIDDFIKIHKKTLDSTNFVEYIHQLREAYHLEVKEIAKSSYIDSTYCYQIFRGIRVPSRNRLIQLAIGMGATIDETNRLLKLAGKSELYPKKLKDAIIIYGIKNNLSIMDIEEILLDKGVELILE